MLTCDDVKQALPLLATGEHQSPEIREHLATCDACREAHGQAIREIDGLREGLASLAPTPFLEDAVIDAAHRASADAPRRKPWAYVAVAAAAVAALLLVVVLPRLVSTSENLHGAPVDGEDGAAARPGIRIPPTPTEVEQARRTNLRHGASFREEDSGGLKIHSAVAVDGSFESRKAGSFLPAPEHLVHRYVYGDAGADWAERTYPIRTWPDLPGLVVMGSELMDALGGDVAIAQGALSTTTAPGAAEAEIDLASPEARGAKARVRVRIDRGYGGTLLIQEALAYALGLNLFEIPGGVHFDEGQGRGTTPVVGMRARARIAIPGLEFDRVVEVQVIPDRPWPAPGTLQGPRGLSFPGERPWLAVEARDLRWIPLDSMDVEMRAIDARVAMAEEGSEGLERLETEAGARCFVLGFPRSRPADPAAHGSPIEALRELGEADLIPRALDLLPGRMRRLNVERVRLEGRWEPGAPVLIARVWRGRTASPSLEPVIRTEVAEDGTIEFPRIAGEPGRTLRMLVVKPDGTGTFHEVVVDPALVEPLSVPVAVYADGSVALPGWTTRLFNVPGEERLTPAEQAQALRGIRDRFASMTRDPAMRDERRFSRMELSLTVAPDAPWQIVQWLMQIGAEPTIAIHKLSLALPGGVAPPQRVRLPLGEGSHAIRMQRRMIAIRLLKREAGQPLRIRVGDADVAPEDLVARLKSAIAGVDPNDEEIIGELKTPRPSAVTFGAAFDAIRAFREAGIDDVRLEGAPAPIPR